MKKITIISLGMALGAFSITACSKTETPSSDCCTLSVTAGGQTMTTKYCKKDANTVTATINGVSTDLSGASLGNMTADAYMSSVKAAGCK